MQHTELPILISFLANFVLIASRRSPRSSILITSEVLMFQKFFSSVQTYKNAENIYAKGIETPHGRIQIVFDVIQKNLDKLTQCHPKTDFIAFNSVISPAGVLVPWA